MKNLSQYISEGRYADQIWGGLVGKIKPFVKQNGSDEAYVGWAPLSVIIEAVFNGNIPDKNDYGKKKDGTFFGVQFTFGGTKRTGDMEPIKNLINNTKKDEMFPFIVSHKEKNGNIWEEHVYVKIINPEQLIEISSYDCTLDEFIKYFEK